MCRFAPSSGSAFEMRHLSIFLAAFLSLAFFGGCQSSPSPAPFTAAVIRAGAANHANEDTLLAGRALFVSRCIECHTLPVVSRHSASTWPDVVEWMAKRAELKPAERDAVIAYVLAVRTQH